MNLHRVLILWSVLAAGAHAADVSVALILPEDKIAAGTKATVELVAMNPGAGPARFNLPERVGARLAGDHTTWSVELQTGAPYNDTIEPKAFVSRAFTFTVPPDASGRLQLEINTPFSARGALVVGSSRRETVTSFRGRETDEMDDPETPAVANIERAFVRNFVFHEPIYFVYGMDAPAAKFQFSFKYRLFGTDGMLGNSIPPFHGLYFGYTQRSLWDIEGESSPFYDTSYMPELIFETLAPASHESHGGLRWLGLQAAFRHESNGRDGIDSRSLNIAYLRAALSIGRLDGWRLVVIPRVFAYTSRSEGNADIARYRGNGDLTLTFGRNGGPQLSVSGQLGDNWDKGSIQVDFTQPVHIPFGNFDTYLQVQYFDGYGESLRAYDQKSTSWRAGFAFVR